ITDIWLPDIPKERGSDLGRLIEIDDEFDKDVVVPGAILIRNVTKSINCGKGG
nr:hypothetical protein [Tanacetum cinerariifolium]